MRWRLWDFGTRQYVQDALLGQCWLVHGSTAALFADGPFRLVVEEGRPLLIGLDGSEEDCALHFVDDHVVAACAAAEGGILGDFRVTYKDSGDKPEQMLSTLQRETDAKALELQIGEGLGPFKADFSWHRAPRQIGSITVSVWLSFRWVVEFVLGPIAQKYVPRYAQKVRRELERLGLDAGHCRESELSRKRKRRPSDDDMGQPGEAGGSQEWLLSMVGAFVFLEAVASHGRFGPKDGSGRRKALALLIAVLKWPLLGESTIAFCCKRGKCELLLEDMVVDYVSLAGSERAMHGGHCKSKRTGLRVCVFSNVGVSI